MKIKNKKIGMYIRGGLIISLFLCFLGGCSKASKEVTLSLEKTTSVSESQKEESSMNATQEKRYKEETSSSTVSEVRSNEDPLQKARSQYIICIDPGHQKEGDSSLEPIGPGASQMKAKVTTGTKGVATGRYESEVVLEIGLKLKALLEAAGYQVVMVRESQDVNLSNSQRAAIANESGAHAFLRLHLDGSEDQSASGILAICQSASNPYCGDLYTSSYALSSAVLTSLVEITGSFNRGIWERDNMSGINWARVPVTILELGFMTNPREDELCSDEAYQDLLCQGMLNGLDEYFNIGNE